MKSSTWSVLEDISIEFIEGAHEFRPKHCERQAELMDAREVRRFFEGSKRRKLENESADVKFRVKSGLIFMYTKHDVHRLLGNVGRPVPIHDKARGWG